MNLFGSQVHVVFLLKNEDVMAYAWHYSKEKAVKHMSRIMDFHSLNGEIVFSEKLEKWLSDMLRKVVIEGAQFDLPDFSYTYRRVYEEIIKIPRGSTLTYSEIARKAEMRYVDVLKALMKNPFQILIPCHRLVTKKGTLMGFYPLGVDVKRELLRIEGAGEF